MRKNLSKFGNLLKELRIKRGLSLREITKLVGYDSSNWSKIERGLISPPADGKTLNLWAVTLGLKDKSDRCREFMDNAQVAQGIIPDDVLSQKNVVDYLPAFFRTIRNKKPTREEISQLIKLIKNS